MADNSIFDGSPAGTGHSKTNMPDFSTRVLAQYIKDLTFDNSFAKNDFSSDSAPDLSVQVELETKKRSKAGQHEVTTKLTVTSKSRDKNSAIFSLNIEYAGIFETSEIPEDQLPPFLLIECPRITFPFVRRLAMDIVRDGGFPPLNLDSINFLEIYETERKRRWEH